MKKIVPTVGRKVWFYPSESFAVDNDMVLVSDQPCDATIVHVNDKTDGENPDFIVNLLAVDHEAYSTPAVDVPLLMPDDSEAIAKHRLSATSYATWMPYQAAQVK